MEKQRKRLASIELLKADIHLHLGARAASRKALEESSRWEESVSKNAKKHKLALLIAEELYGLALKELNAHIKNSPFDKKLLQKQIDLYGKLGWDERWAEQSRLRIKLRENRVALPQ